MSTQLQVHLNTVENLIFRELNDMNKLYNLNSTIRVVGGWVRDKLLGKESHDIDITVDNMSGVAFAQNVQKYMTEHTSHVISSIGVIQPNPKAGKHLETATLHIDHLPLDFCNLRGEDYATSTETKIGTPIQDAQHRDFTVNSLFYRINDNVVEDSTNLGLQDLISKTIRAPLQPLQTLKDDPLRCLRAIRFSAQLEFIIEETLEDAMKSNTIRELLVKDIKRERIGKELTTMLNTNHVSYCIEKCINCGYFEQIIGACKTIDTIGVIRGVEVLCNYYNCTLQRMSAYLSALTLSFSGEETEQRNHVKSILTESLKLSSKESNQVLLIHNGYYEMKRLSLLQTPTRVDYGKVLLKANEFWKYSIILFASQMVEVAGPCLLPTTELIINDNIIKYVNNMFTIINDYQLDNVWKMKPLINGDDIAKLLNKKKGFWLKSTLEQVILYQIQFPNAQKLDVINYVKTLSLDDF
ncbi:PolyA polymerase [Entamoeba marina]